VGYRSYFSKASCVHLNQVGYTSGKTIKITHISGHCMKYYVLCLPSPILKKDEGRLSYGSVI
jgi:hypothetical protein